MCRIAFEECDGKVHLLGGAIDTSTQRVIERIQALKGCGYRNLVVVPTFYLKLKLPEEHLRLYGECREAAGDMNIIAYNVPSCTGSVIPIETMCEMARRGWIQCCKDSSEDMQYFGRLLSEGGPLGLRVLIGTERHAAEALLMGAHGLVPVCANYEPLTFIAAYDARQDAAKLPAIQERISTLVENLLLTPRSWLAGVKYSVAARGIGSGRPISPTEPLNDKEKNHIDRFCKQSPPSSPGTKRAEKPLMARQ
jgi:4-hydroxy-tetrahydrodipicolinate synthase